MSKTLAASAKQRRKFVFILGLLLIPFALTGCFKFTIDLEVSSQDTVSGTSVFALSEALTALAQEGGGGEPTDAFEEIDGVTVSEFDDGNFVGQQYDFSGVPIESFALNDDASALSIERNGDNLVLRGNLSLEDEGADPAAGEDLGFGQEFFDSADLRVSIKFPGEILETNGKIDESTNTITWVPKFGEANDLSATVYAPKGIPIWVWVTISSVLLAMLLAVAAVVTVRRSRSLSSRNERQEPSVEPENVQPSMGAQPDPIENVRFSYKVKGRQGVFGWLGLGSGEDLEVTLGRDVLRYVFQVAGSGALVASEDLKVSDISEATFISDPKNGMAVRLTVRGGIVDIPASPGDGKTLVKLLRKPAMRTFSKDALPVAPPAVKDGDAFEMLERLHALKEKGILSEAEFLAKKDEVLKRL